MLSISGVPMLSVPRHLLTRCFPLPVLGALTLLLIACDANSQACESNVDCYVGESCVLGTCVLDEDPDLDVGSDTTEEDADTPYEDAGDTDQSDTDTHIPDGPPHPIAISAAMNVSCALLSDATVWCWGDNSASFISGGDDEALTPRKIDGFDGAVEIATANARLCARMQDGAVLCRGDGSNGSGTTLETKIDGGATRLSAGGFHMCATVGEDATLHCWGDNGFGQTGADGEQTAEPTPVEGASNIVHIAAGDFHTCASTDADQVLCFSDNYARQLGVEGGESLEPVTHPFFSPTTYPVFELVAGSTHTCALSESAEVWCWGDNTFGQLAIDTELLENSAEPDGVVADDALEKLAAGNHRTCGVGTAGRVFCWGQDHTETIQHVHAIPFLQGVTQLAIGQNHTCALTEDNAIFCWGANASGQLGINTRGDETEPGFAVVPSWED
ncbi:hypothetical protein FRC96_15285 [Lujinxingia vulgaris]|uniref:BNR repeat domain protein n=2 Tax=Lujinxingia vulgaris TaxID=2600176 RepID=A0A5C6X9C0_9DELT|nr:hypothetical protein FRC96_15285 [Lujinxingia vulgaris]